MIFYDDIWSKGRESAAKDGSVLFDDRSEGNGVDNAAKIMQPRVFEGESEG